MDASKRKARVDIKDRVVRVMVGNGKGKIVQVCKNSNQAESFAEGWNLSLEKELAE